MSEKFLYMTSIGRVSGKPHRIEIWFAEHEGCFYMCCEYPDKSDWVKNIKKNPAVQFHVSEREEELDDRSGLAEVVTDETELEPVKAQFREKYNWDDGLFVRICEVL
jgi:general stress protein 26